MAQKIYSKMHPVSCTNIHHDVTDLLNHGMVKNTKTWISWERNIIFLRNKKILNLCLRWYILRSYRFVAEATFKAPQSFCNIQVWRIQPLLNRHDFFPLNGGIPPGFFLPFPSIINLFDVSFLPKSIFLFH